MGWTRIDPERFPAGAPTNGSSGPYRDASGSLSDLVIWRAWWSTTAHGSRFLALFAILWNGFLAVILSHVLAGSPMTVNGVRHASLREALHRDPTTWLIALFPIVGAVMGYLALALWINRTTITVNRNTVTVARGPLPWRRGLVVIDALGIQQLFVEGYVSHQQNEVPVTAFRVKARLADGSDVVVDQGMGNHGDARVLEQWIERKLRIVDEPVPGEDRDHGASAAK